MKTSFIKTTLALAALWLLGGRGQSGLTTPGISLTTPSGRTKN